MGQCWHGINVKVKVKSLFQVHTQAQSFGLQTLTSTYPGHWVFPVRIYPSRYPSQLSGEYTASHMQLGATAYKSALTDKRLLLGLEKQCSVKCLAQGHNEPMHRQGINYWTRVLTKIFIPITALYHWTRRTNVIGACPFILKRVLCRYVSNHFVVIIAPARRVRQRNFWN